MPPKAGQTKEKKAAAAAAGGKKSKKKWSKGKTRDALQNAVMFDKDTLKKLESEVPKYKVITGPVVSDRLKLSVALANQGLKHLLAKKLIRTVSVMSNGFRVYTRAVVDAPKDAAAAPAKKAEKPAEKKAE